MMSAIRLTVFVVVAAFGVPPATVTEAGARQRGVASERGKARRSGSHAVRKRKKIASKRLRFARRHQTPRRIQRGAAHLTPAVPAADPGPVPAIPTPPKTREAVAPLGIPEGATAEQRLDAIERGLGDMEDAVARAQARVDDLKARVLQPKGAGEADPGGPGSVSAPSI